MTKQNNQWGFLALILLQLGFALPIFLFSLGGNSQQTKNHNFSAATIIQATNNVRRQHQLPNVRFDPKLQAVAKARAEDIIDSHSFDHYIPDSRTPWEWLEAKHYIYDFAAENLAINYSTTETLLAAWMKSSSHRQNILDARVQEIGVAVVPLTGDSHDYLVIQILASEKPETILTYEQQ